YRMESIPSSRYKGGFGEVMRHEFKTPVVEEPRPVSMKGSADQLRIMIDKIPTLAWACRPDGTTEFLNQRWLDYTGLSLEQALGFERDRLRLLLEVNKALVSNLDLPNLFRALAESIRRVTDCDFIGLALPDPVTGQLRQALVDYRESRGVITEGMLVPLHGS